MNTYSLLRPVYRPIDSVYYRLSFETIRLLKAPNAEAALAQAKRLGYRAPVIGSAQESVQ